MRRHLRLSLDVNVWVAYLISLRRNYTGTVPMRVIDMLLAGKVGTVPVQLVIAKETLGTLERVAAERGIAIGDVSNLVAQIINIARYGPEQLNPFLFFGREMLQMRDQEDAGVLASAIITRCDFLLTDNLDDFRNKDAWEIDGETLTAKGKTRKLVTIVHERADGVAIVIAHPIVFMRWVDAGLVLSIEAIARHYGIEWPTSTRNT